MRRFLPFAALLGVALVLGCQEQVSGPVGPEGPQFDQDVNLIAEGEFLFFNEPFGGNGRTCGTCHRAENNFTIDIAFINDLHKKNRFDLLFIAEFNKKRQEKLGVDLPPFNSNDPSAPAFEDPVLMLARGLILENIQGFDVDGSGDLVIPPVFRAPPSLFNLSATAPYGLSGNVPNLKEFATGAVIQHFPKTLNRTENVDFVLPTESQLNALQAFMLSLESPADGNFKVFGAQSILSTPADPRAQDTGRPEVNGRDLFFSVGCTSCHRRNKVFSGGNFDTGVEQLGLVSTGDTGDGSGRFQTPGLFGLRKTAFFHNNAVGNTGVQFNNLRAAVAFYQSKAFEDSPTGGQVAAMTPQEIDDITAFLVALSIE